MVVGCLLAYQWVAGVPSGKAIRFAAGVCLGMICAALSVVAGRVGQSQLYGADGMLVGVLVGAGMLVGVLGGLQVVLGVNIGDGVS